MPLPTIVSVTTSNDSDRSGTTLSLKLPASPTAGNTLLAVISQDNPGDPGSIVWPAGPWRDQEFYQTNLSTYIRATGSAIKATGSEPSTISVTLPQAEDVCAVVFEIDSSADAALYPPEKGPGQGYVLEGSGVHNPPSISPSQGTFDYMILAIAHHDRNDVGIDTYPTGYGSTGIINAGTGGTGQAIAYAAKAVNAASEDPGGFDADANRRGLTYAIAIHGNAVAGDARATQGAALTLATPLNDGRVSQAAALMLYAQNMDARVTQAAVLALAPQIPCAPKRCQVWKITRRDGQVFRFTTTDTPVTYRGEVYTPCGSLAATAAEAAILNASGGGDLEASGIIRASGITEKDMANGLFDGARLTVWVIPWDDPTLASDVQRRIIDGVLGETSQNHVNYQAQIFTMSAKLSQQPLLQVFTAACRFQPGDGKCPLDLDAYKFTGAVETTPGRLAINRQSYRQFSDVQLTGGDSSSGGYPSGSGPLSSIGYDSFWVGGTVTWLTGQNAGLSSEVKNYQQGQVTLWAPMPHEIQVGDQYEITPGCNLTKSDHVNKFGLPAASFGGFEDLPGLDSVVRGLL